MEKFRVFRSKHYKSKLIKLKGLDYERAIEFEQNLKTQPFTGKPLGYKFFREKKFNGKETSIFGV